MTSSPTFAFDSKTGIYWSWGMELKPEMDKYMQAAAIVFSENWMAAVVKTLDWLLERELHSPTNH